MIVNKKDRSEVSSNVKDSVFFGIKKEGFSHIFNVLRNQLYSDKELAVVREYSANAYDAHVQKGISDRPFEVNLPSRLDPFFKVRDFGSGLTHDEVHDIYANYGESTKRCSNDYIGQLGLGSKSAFAYTDTFNITSIVDGKKNVYCAFIDESDLGKITLLESVDTDEEDGIEISVPVSQDDVDTFLNRAERVFRYYETRPKVFGQTIEYGERVMILEGDDWRITNDSNGSVVAIMGNIGYPIDGYALDEYDSDILNLGGLQIDFEIGELEMSASREALQYTELTKKSIGKKFKRIKKEIIEKVSENFGECKTVWDAKTLWYKLFDMTSELYRLRHIVSKDIKINNHKIEGSQYYFEGEDASVYTVGKTQRSRNYKTEKDHRIECRPNTILIENDLGNNRGLLGRILPLVLEKQLKPYVFTFSDKKSRDKYKDFDPTDIKKLSDFPKISLKELSKKHSGIAGTTSSYATSGGSDGIINTKHTTKIFSLDSKASSGWRTKASDYWNEAEVDFDNDSGVYVILDRFKMMDSQSGFDDNDGGYFRNIESLFGTLDLDTPKIYGIKTAASKKIEGKENWTSLREYFTQTILEILEDEGLAETYLNSIAHDNFEREYGTLSKISKSDGRDLINLIGEDSPAYPLIEQITQVEKSKEKVSTIKQLIKYAGVEGKVKNLLKGKGYNFIKEEKKLMKRYSMLNIIDRYSFGHYGKKDKNLEIVAEYINKIDSLEN